MHNYVVRTLFITLLALVLSACGGGGGSTASGSKSFGGVAQKGPYAEGASITFHELDSAAVRTGEFRTTSVSGIDGGFSFTPPAEWGDYVEIVARGLYLDEFSATTASRFATLTAIVNVADVDNHSVNLLTHFAAARARQLVASGSDLAAALQQAHAELEDFFGTGAETISALDLTLTGENAQSNALLLLLSGALLEVSAAEGANPQRVVGDLVDDFADDGWFNGVGRDWLDLVQQLIALDPGAFLDAYSSSLRDSLGFDDTPDSSHLPGIVKIATRPVADAGEDLLVRPGQPVVLDASASTDADGAIEGYTWFQIDHTGPGVLSSDRFNVTTAFTAPNVTQPTILLFAVIVTDDQGVTDIDIITVTVAPNLPPVAAASAPENADEGAQVTLDGSASNDPDGEVASYYWLQTGGSTVSLDLSDPSMPVFTAPPVSESETLVFQLVVTDNEGLESDPVEVSVIINSVNNTPVAVDDEVFTNEDTPLVLSSVELVIPNDTDPDGDSLSITSVGTASAGSLFFSAGVITYTPTANFFGSDSFTYTIDDGNGGTASATVNVTVLPVNDLPVADPGDVVTNEDVPVGITLSGSDPVENSPLTFNLGSAPVNGTLSGSVPNLTYTPNPNFNGSDSFTFSVNDGTDDSAPATVTVTVLPVNDPPVADSNEVGTDEDTAVGITLTGSDPVENSPIGFNVVNGPANGMLSGTAPNLTYTPDLDFNGSDSFTFIANDGTDDSPEATIFIFVAPVNDDPVAVDDTVQTDEDTNLVLGNAELVDPNDSDVDGDPLAIIDVGPASNGSAILLTGGGPAAERAILIGSAISYTPNPDYNGPDSFTYTIDDGNGGTATATVNVTVNPVNDDPVAVDDDVSTDEDTPLLLGNADIVDPNDSDIDGDSLTITGVGTATNGSAVLVTGGISYTPNPDYFGPDSFTYSIEDGGGGTATATVNVTVNPVNDDPVAVDDNVSTDEDTPLALDNLLIVDPNDSDVDGDSLTIIGVTTAAQGTTSVKAGFITYTPNPDYNGPDSFSYTISDGNGGTAMAVVNVTVNPVNDDPVAVDDNATTDEDTLLTLDATDLVDPNDTDVDGDTLTITNVGNPTNGSTSLISGIIEYQPNPDYFGPDSFSYTIDDGNGGSATATVFVTVLPVLDPPLNLTVTRGAFERVDLEWSNSIDSDTHRVYYSTDPAVSPTNFMGSVDITSGTPGDTVGTQITGLTNFTDYYFIVTALAPPEESDPDGPVMGTPGYHEFHSTELGRHELLFGNGTFCNMVTQNRLLNSLDDRQLFLTCSTDDGATWSPVAEIGADLGGRQYRANMVLYTDFMQQAPVDLAGIVFSHDTGTGLPSAYFVEYDPAAGSVSPSTLIGAKNDTHPLLAAGLFDETLHAMLQGPDPANGNSWISSDYYRFDQFTIPPAWTAPQSLATGGSFGGQGDLFALDNYFQGFVANKGDLHPLTSWESFDGFVFVNELDISQPLPPGSQYDFYATVQTTFDAVSFYAVAHVAYVAQNGDSVDSFDIEYLNGENLDGFLWNAPMEITPAAFTMGCRTPDAVKHAAPSLSVSESTGRLYVTWSQPDGTSDPTLTGAACDEDRNWDVYVSYSDDNGATWSAPQFVHADAAPLHQMHPRIAVGAYDPASGDETVIVSYEERDTHTDGFIRLIREVLIFNIPPA